MITVRQLLNHTNGIAGDFFPDDGGCEGNPIARYVDRCNLLPIIHPIGEMYSYSNSAFAIAGRLIEVVLGISWYQAMQEFIYRPLGMNQAIADPAEAIRYRAAMGHVVRDGNADQWQLAEKAYLPLGLAPVGSTPTMSAANLITFARAHLDKGLSQSGERWLSTASIAEMQRPHIELPKYSHISCKYAGIGWGITDYNPNNTRVIGHGGATSGSLAMVNILPAQNSAYVILMNGFQPTAMDAINRDLLMAVAGIDTTEPDPAPTLSIPLEPYIGSYESLDIVIDIRMADEMLVANIDYKTDPLPPTDLALVPVDENCFAAYTGEGTRAKNLAFVPHYADDRPAYLFLGGRLNRRVSREKAI